MNPILVVIIFLHHANVQLKNIKQPKQIFESKNNDFDRRCIEFKN
jgi:hypothetical protein